MEFEEKKLSQNDLTMDINTILNKLRNTEIPPNEFMLDHEIFIEYYNHFLETKKYDFLYKLMACVVRLDLIKFESLNADQKLIENLYLITANIIGTMIYAIQCGDHNYAHSFGRSMYDTIKTFECWACDTEITCVVHDPDEPRLFKVGFYYELLGDICSFIDKSLMRKYYIKAIDNFEGIENYEFDIIMCQYAYWTAKDVMNNAWLVHFGEAPDFLQVINSDRCNFILKKKAKMRNRRVY